MKTVPEKKTQTSLLSSLASFQGFLVSCHPLHSGSKRAQTSKTLGKEKKLLSYSKCAKLTNTKWSVSTRLTWNVKKEIIQHGEISVWSRTATQADVVNVSGEGKMEGRRRRTPALVFWCVAFLGLPLRLSPRGRHTKAGEVFLDSSACFYGGGWTR